MVWDVDMERSPGFCDQWVGYFLIFWASVLLAVIIFFFRMDGFLYRGLQAQVVVIAYFTGCVDYSKLLICFFFPCWLLLILLHLWLLVAADLIVEDFWLISPFTFLILLWRLMHIFECEDLAVEFLVLCWSL
ncbi:hypothetical protein Droror1_Dr00023605 [Drosera rotundifolia]